MPKESSIRGSDHGGKEHLLEAMGEWLDDPAVQMVIVEKGREGTARNNYPVYRVTVVR